MRLEKVLGTTIVWAGVCVLSYMFNSFGILNGNGAGWMVIGALLLTAGIWKMDF